MSAAEKLKALDLGPGSIDDAEFGTMGYDGLLELRDALPQIVAVVKAVENDEICGACRLPAWRHASDCPLLALDEMLGT